MRAPRSEIEPRMRGVSTVMRGEAASAASREVVAGTVAGAPGVGCAAVPGRGGWPGAGAEPGVAAGWPGAGAG